MATNTACLGMPPCQGRLSPAQTAPALAAPAQRGTEKCWVLQWLNEVQVDPMLRLYFKIDYLIHVSYFRNMYL